MIEILGTNGKACLLAHSLWQFFDFRLSCCVQEDDGDASRYGIKIETFLDSKNSGDLQPYVSIRRTERQEEALVHELLHINLILLGYPRFRIWEEPGSSKWNLAAGITNDADHLVMFPIYLSFGYREDRFLGPSRTPTQLEKRVSANLAEMGTQLSTPEGYGVEVFRYLRSHAINCEPVSIAGLILQEANK
jgi:hypothetical protein